MSVNNAYEIAQQEFDHVADMLDLDEEARTFLRRAEKAEQNYKGTDNRDNHPYCLMAHGILSKAGML